jgi:hypothetical protein
MESDVTGQDGQHGDLSQGLGHLERLSDDRSHETGYLLQLGRWEFSRVGWPRSATQRTAAEPQCRCRSTRLPGRQPQLHVMHAIVVCWAVRLSETFDT